MTQVQELVAELRVWAAASRGDRSDARREEIFRAAADALEALQAEREALQARAEKAEGERDEARARLFPYADDTEISGMSWNGFYLIGNSKSIGELKRIENRSAQLEQFSAAYEEAIAREKARIAELEAGLNDIADSDDVENMLDPACNKRTAAALLRRKP